VYGPTSRVFNFDPTLPLCAHLIKLSFGGNAQLKGFLPHFTAQNPIPERYSCARIVSFHPNNTPSTIKSK
jgi:hypothetical protein